MKNDDKYVILEGVARAFCIFGSACKKLLFHKLGWLRTLHVNEVVYFSVVFSSFLLSRTVLVKSPSNVVGCAEIRRF